MADLSYASGGESRPLSEGGNGIAHEQPVTTEPPPLPARTGSVVDPGYAPVEMRTTGRTGGDVFVLVTFALGMIGWLTALVAQAYVAAKINNELVRIVWFGFVIQTILSVVVLEVITAPASYNASYAYGTQISILAALAAAFAVLGVDRTIYLQGSAFKATGAGWLIVAIVDVLWILWFTSPPSSPVARLATSMSGPRADSAHHPKEETYGKVEKIGRSTDAFPMSAINQQQQPHERVPSMVSEGRAGVGAGQQQWSSYTPGTNPRATVTTAPSEGARSTTHTAGGGIAVVGSDTAMSDRRGSGTTAPPETEGGAPTMTEAESTVKWRAEALFDYKGSSDDPNELPFKKGEILLITDKSGKWWEAKNRDGKKGIAPSNYLRLLPP